MQGPISLYCLTNIRPEMLITLKVLCFVDPNPPKSTQSVP